MTEIQAPFPLGLSDEEMRDLPRLFEEFSRTTSELVATHETLRAQVQSLKRELADKNQRLERKKRLEALGSVAAGVAHEFRNPLGGIRLTVDALLQGRVSSEEVARERLERVRLAVEHLDHIVADLLTFTARERLSFRPTPVRLLVEHALQIAFAEQDPARRRVVADGAADLEVTVDWHAITQVLVNLLINGQQALTPDRVAHTDGVAANAAAIASDLHDSQPQEIGLGVWWGERDGRVWIEVADNGPGIPEGEEERIFHPFHSLREGGTGLGLAIVHSRVEGHDGEISVVTDAADVWGAQPQWGGARFRILLPLAVAGADSDAALNGSAKDSPELSHEFAPESVEPEE